MSRFRTNNPIGGFGINQRYNAPGVVPTFTQPNQTAGQLGGLLDASLATAGRVVDFQIAAENMRLNKERQDLAAERARQEELDRQAAEQARFNAQTEGLQRGIGRGAANNLVSVLQADIKNARIALPDAQDPASIEAWADVTAERFAQQSGVDENPIVREEFKRSIIPDIVRSYVGERDAVAAQDAEFTRQKYVSTALLQDIGPGVLEEGARSLNYTPDEATVKLYMPFAEAKANAGDVEALQSVSGKVAEKFRPQFDAFVERAKAEQTRALNERVQDDLGGYVKRLASFQTDVTKGQVDTTGIVNLLDELDKRVASADPKYADNYNALAGTVRSMIASSNREALEFAKKQGIEAVKGQIVNQARAMSRAGHLSSSLGDTPIEVDVAGTKVSMSPTEIKNKVRDLEFADIQQRIANDQSIPDADKPRAYGRAIAQWAGKNDMPLDNIKSQMRESFSMLQDAMSGDNPNSQQLVADAARQFEVFKGVLSANNGALGQMDQNTMLFESAKLIQDNAGLLFGRPLSNADALQTVYKNLENVTVSKEKVESAANQAASRWGFFNDASNKGELADQIRTNIRALMVMGSGLGEDKILEKAKELTERQGMILNGYWVKLNSPIDVGFGEDYSPNEAVTQMAGLIANKLKGNPDYTFAGKEISPSDISIRQDQQTGNLFFVDTRVGMGRRIVSQDMNLPSVFTKDALVQEMRRLAMNKATVESKRLSVPSILGIPSSIFNDAVFRDSQRIRDAMARGDTAEANRIREEALGRR